MKGKSIILLLLAMGCGLVAMLGVQEVLQGKSQSGPAMVPVLVAKSDILSGTPLDDTNTGFRDFPEASVPEGVVTKKLQYERRALKVSAVSGEMIMLAKLGEEGEIGASAEIPNGMRVVTVPVTSTDTHAGQMAPGDRVDLIVTYKYRESGTSELVSMSRTILEFIKVFSVDAQRERPGELADTQAKNVSLLVTPQEAQLVMLAKDKGALHLAMRSKNDTVAGKATPIDEETLFGSLRRSPGGVSVQERADLEDTTPDADRNPTLDVLEVLQAEQERQDPPQDRKPDTVNADPVASVSKWKVTVFSGSDTQVEEFDLPLVETLPEPQK